MNMTASRFAYLATFNASLLTALLVAWLAPERGGHLLALGLCAALLMCNVDLLERRMALQGEERDDATTAIRPRSRSLEALDAAQPTVFALCAVLGMVVRDSPVLVMTIAALTLGVGFLSERANRSHRPGSRSAGTLTETWRGRGAARRFDIAYVLFFITIAALSLGLPDDPAFVAPVAVAAVVVLGVIAYGQNLTERRHAQVSPPGSPSARIDAD
ncbi:hypothetical protein [Clavibacter sp. VKM Ac-2872]|uniref:hypothetical protein n=1 Tax=Clavibacter sp. VKM Ac-2872 TaxID=2783812 RepID=UPI00188DA21D|nr:hypothetical protein [Clavibacter sp. VKM Ac-2872]MBF4622731.1 hypothetical protein [Clavibacter sp. VKM Ac-2872]